MEITEVHKNHVKFKQSNNEGNLDYFLLPNNHGWYCIQTNLRYSLSEPVGLCMSSIVWGATETFAESKFSRYNPYIYVDFKPSIPIFRWNNQK